MGRAVAHKISDQPIHFFLCDGNPVGADLAIFNHPNMQAIMEGRIDQPYSGIRRKRQGQDGLLEIRPCGWHSILGSVCSGRALAHSHNFHASTTLFCSSHA